MTVIKQPQPRYAYWVQIRDYSELHPHTRAFLEEHATQPLAEISIEDTNQFLARSWQRANWAGEAYSDGRQPA